MESQSGNLGLGTSLIIPLTLRKYTQKSNRPNIYPLFFHTSRERLFAFFPSRGLYPSEVREKTYTSLTTPGLYFISSRKCEIAQSAIYQKISRHLKLFLNIMFVKSLPKQFSARFFAAHRHFSRRTPRKHHFVAAHSPNPTICRLHHRAYFLSPPPLRRAGRPDWQAASAPPSRGGRETAHRSSLHTAHSPAAHEKWGATKEKLGAFAQKRGCSDRNTPVFTRRPAHTRRKHAHKKGLHPNSFVQSFIF